MKAKKKDDGATDCLLSASDRARLKAGAEVLERLAFHARHSGYKGLSGEFLEKLADDASTVLRVSAPETEVQGAG